MSTLKILKTPIFAAEGILHLDRQEYRLQIKASGREQTLSLLQLQNDFPQTAISMRLTSVSGWTVRANWNGIIWNDFITSIGLAETARYAVFTSAGQYDTAVWLNDLSASTAMLVWGVDGEPLENEYGGPLRMIIPNLWGYKSCKWLASVEFCEKYRPGYWEKRGYTHRGEIQASETFDVNTQTYRKIEAGEVMNF